VTISGSTLLHRLHLLPQELEIVRGILLRHIPEKKVWAFGSRATGVRLKRFSDLDLAVEGRLTAREGTGLEQDFDESLLPMKVDVVELDEVSAEFRARIEKDFVVVQAGL